MYRITTDIGKAIIEVRIEGFWSPDGLEPFARDLRGHVAAIARTGRRHALLYDYSHAVIQSQAVVGALRDMARRNDFGTRRVALYSANRLARGQAQRIAAAAGERLAVFDDRQAALAWLTVG